MAHAVAELGGAEAPRGSEHVDRLEEARLAGTVAAEHEVGAPFRPPDQRLQVAEAVGGQLGEHGGLEPRVGGELWRAGAAQMRIGMITQR